MPVSINIGEEVYQVTSTAKIIESQNYSITPLDESFYFVDLLIDNIPKGCILIGKIKATVDSLVYTKKYGAIGNPTIFQGSNLTVMGLYKEELEEKFTIKGISDLETVKSIRTEAENMISKVKSKICSSSSKIEFDDKDDDCKYIIIGRRNFVLVGGRDKFVLVTKQHIAVRSGENSLVRISPEAGIEIANGDKVLNIGRGSPFNLESVLGGLGVRIASTILDEMVWE